MGIIYWQPLNIKGNRLEFLDWDRLPAELNWKQKRTTKPLSKKRKIENPALTEDRLKHLEQVEKLSKIQVRFSRINSR